MFFLMTDLTGDFGLVLAFLITKTSLVSFVVEQVCILVWGSTRS